MGKPLGRRRALQTLVLGSGALAFSRFIAACSDAGTSDRVGGPGTSTPPAPTPNDGDEYVPGKGTPVETGDTPPKVPNPQWEARVRQLEDQQKQRFGAVFTATAAGPMTGK